MLVTLSSLAVRQSLSTERIWRHFHMPSFKELGSLPLSLMTVDSNCSINPLQEI